MKELFNNIVGSFNNGPDGASGKKLTALFSTIFCFVAPIVTWTIWAFTHNDWSLLTGILAIVTSFICLLFGINVYEKTKSTNDNKDSNGEAK